MGAPILSPFEVGVLIHMIRAIDDDVLEAAARKCAASNGMDVNRIKETFGGIGKKLSDSLKTLDA